MPRYKQFLKKESTLNLCQSFIILLFTNSIRPVGRYYLTRTWISTFNVFSPVLNYVFFHATYMSHIGVSMHKTFPVYYKYVVYYKTYKKLF
jgi:hypothetical protein